MSFADLPDPIEELFLCTDLSGVLASAQSVLDQLEERRQSLQAEISALECLGAQDASMVYSHNNGLVIYHRDPSQGRQEEHVGKDPEKLKAALECIERFNHTEQLKDELFFLELQLSRAKYHLDRFVAELYDTSKTSD